MLELRKDVLDDAACGALMQLGFEDAEALGHLDDRLFESLRRWAPLVAGFREDPVGVALVGVLTRGEVEDAVSGVQTETPVRFPLRFVVELIAGRFVW